MIYGAIDLHKQSSQFAICDENGSIEEFELPTERRALIDAFKRRKPTRLLLESSTESEWVALLLEDLGHEPIVADPNFSAMYATRGKGIKTNRRDARALLDACRSNMYRPAYRRRRGQRYLRQQILLRQSLVRSRTRLICGIRSILRQEGLRVDGRHAETFVSRVRERKLPRRMTLLLEPLLLHLDSLNQTVVQMEKHLCRRAKRSARIQRLMSTPGVGPISALAYTALIDDPQRFACAESVRCYLGLVPSEDSSSDYQHRGPITKAGNSQVRGLLVQDGWCLLRGKTPAGRRLREWGQKIAARRGKGKAVVAMARKLAGVLWAMDLNQKEFDMMR